MTPHRHNSWSISPRSLPDPSLFKDEPLLQDLENNAIYRMMVFRAAGTPWLELGRRSLGCLAPIILFCITAATGIVSALVFGVLIIGVLFWASQNRPGDRGYLMELDRERFADLLNTPADKDDFISAVWGRILAQSRNEWVGDVVLLILLFAVLLVVLAYWDPRWLVLASPPTFYMAYRIELRRHKPWILLPHLRKTMEKAAIRIDTVENRFFIGCANLFLIGWLLMIGIGFLSLMGAFVGSLVDRPSPHVFWASNWMIPIAVAGAFAAGYFGILAARAKARTLKADRQTWLNSTRIHVNDLIKRTVAGRQTS